MPEKPMCKDCRWIKPVDPRNPSYDSVKCVAPKAPRSPVDGEPNDQCWHVRCCVNLCGPEGRWFEAKEAIPPPQLAYQFAGIKFLKEIETYQQAVKDYIESLKP